MQAVKKKGQEEVAGHWLDKLLVVEVGDQLLELPSVGSILNLNHLKQYFDRKKYHD
jgi:hypothetical protein